MATVPTLLVNAVDQTAYVQHRTLGFRLQTLDFTLVDPATEPQLHNNVALDEPYWTGRVSTIESTPFKSANGDDHRYVKVTATNKHVAPDDTAPFDLSDTPNMSTTFPYKDLVRIQTLADQTDLATEENRIQATIYEPGIIPGMTVGVTCVAEGLTAEPYIVTEVTVSWLRSDSPEFRLEGSDTGVPPVTLGGLIDSAGCDCAPFVPCDPDYTVPNTGGAEDIYIVFPDHTNGQSLTSTAQMTLYYNDATYGILYECFHAADSNGLTATLAAVGGGALGTGSTTPCDGTGSTLFMGDKARHCSFDPPNDVATCGELEWTPSGIGGSDSFDVQLQLSEGSCTAGDSYASSLSAHIRYIEGPDPRFTSDPCEGVVPHSGQRLQPQHITGDGTTDTTSLDYPYMSGTVEVFVEGVDWSDLVTETDPATGEFAVAYPYPLATDPHPNVEIRYRYP